MSPLFESLNEAQKKAAFFVDGSSLILAGAGSGKTRVLIAKVVYLIKEKKVSPSSIMMVTFTNKAALEMKERIEKELGSNLKLGYIGTFHSFGALVLRRFWKEANIAKNFLIYDEDEQLSLIKNILKKEKIEKLTPSFFAYYISLAKNEMITPEVFLEKFSFYKKNLVAQVYYLYQKALEENNALDFDDLLLKTVFLFKKNPSVLDFYQKQLNYFLIDEFQDTNFLQYELIKSLAKKAKQVTAVGDFSQSIYSWRGAKMENLFRFQKDFSKVSLFYLEKNYRSTQKILDFAYQVISQNQSHPILKLYTDKDGGEEVEIFEAENEEEEAMFVAREILEIGKKPEFFGENIAVLYRVNAQSRILEEVFLHFGIPYILIGGVRFYERKEIKDILAFLRLLLYSNDQLALERVKKLGKKRFSAFKNFYEKINSNLENYSTSEIIEGILKETDYLSLYQSESEEDFSRLENINELKTVASNFPNLIDFLDQVALVEAEYFEGEKKEDGKNKVRLMTLHQAKGLEFDYVFIVGVEEGLLPHSRSFDDFESLEEERRLFYVGITRAKKKLYISFAKKRFIFGRRFYALKSRFLEKVLKDDEDYSW
jgi:DNA helicase II / ATP-dependent DNA helicase PcrA